MRGQAVYIVGCGHSRFGRLPHTLEELILEVSGEAVSDSGLDFSDIDAVFLGHFNGALVPESFASSLVLASSPALRFKPATRCENACASGAAALYAGIDTILGKRARNVLVVGVEKMTHRSTAEVTRSLAGAGYQGNPEEACLSFPEVFAIAAVEYATRFSDPADAMARIASKNHLNAIRNPLAHMQRPLSVEYCSTISEKNPLVAPPLRLTDCSLVTDGAAAIVLSSADGAASARQRVRIKAAEHVSDRLPMSGRDLVGFEGPRAAIERAYHNSGVGVGDLDFAEVHDCFTIAELLIYEAMGLATPGRGADALDSGLVFDGGRTPVNLSGGLKAKGHPVGATGVSMHALGFRQLTGRAVGPQREGAEIGLIFNMGGAAVASYATILVADRN